MTFFNILVAISIIFLILYGIGLIIVGIDKKKTKEAADKRFKENCIKLIDVLDKNLSKDYKKFCNGGIDLIFDYGKKLFWITDANKGEWENYKFSEITGCETRINGSTSHSVGETKTKNGIKRAIAGGILAGGVGAIVGSVTAKKETKMDTTSTFSSIQLLIYLKSKKKNLLSFTFYNANDCDEVVASIKAIVNK